MSQMYDLYLSQHKANVAKAFDWIQENIPEVLPVGVDCEWNIKFVHDQSKSQPDEYEAYDEYFYGNNKSYRVVQNFNKAWLLHIHRNPHHWQHWVLINDDPNTGSMTSGIITVDMPQEYIIEMICDWWSFSWNTGDLREIFKWYGERKDYLMLSKSTRETVENILDKIKAKLDNEEESLCHHGVKGQKWGVKNGPPYPIDRSTDNIVENAIKSGQVSKEINREKQTRHTKDGHMPGRSYINGDLEFAQELVDKLSGTGIAIKDRNGNWTHKERVTADTNIAVYSDRESGEEHETNKAIIHYSKTGAHIMAGKEEN